MAERLSCKESFLPMRMKSLFAQYASAAKSTHRALALCVGALFLAGCGLLSGPAPTPTLTRPVLASVPTFTSTPPGAQPAQGATDGGAQVQQPAPADTPPAPADTPPAPADTPTPEPDVARFTVKTDLAATAVNVRTGPSTAFGVIGTVSRGDQFEISGRNPENTWYEFCCVNGQQGWIFSGLVNVENAHLITLAQNIPATPVPPTATPVPPTAVPTPAQVDHCAGIGGDGCKFKLRNRDLRENGGREEWEGGRRVRPGFSHPSQFMGSQAHRKGTSGNEQADADHNR